MLTTKGWELVGRVLDGMITGTIGYKDENGRWQNGAVDNKSLGEQKARDWVIYKRALIDFHTNIYKFVDDMNKKRNEYENLKQQEELDKRPRYTKPMEDTEYGKVS